MNNSRNQTWLKISTAVAFLIMITINALANIIPIGGIGTGEVSDAYPNLFAPAPITFAVWGLIYILLAIFTLYQAGIIKNEKDDAKNELIGKLRILFLVSSLVNSAWIFSWHYELIGLSLILMTALLTLLIVLMLELKAYKLTKREKIFVRLPFSIYFGWITVAAIANAVTFFVSVNWEGFGLSDSFWTVLVLIIGTLIGVLAIFSYKDFFYGLVLVWAYSGILIKHISLSGFGGEYTSVIITAGIGVALFIIADIVMLFREKVMKKE